MKLKLFIFLITCFGAVPLWAQSTISGTITDESSQPLPGVNITIKGTTTGVAADFDGNFTINAEQGQTLVFTSLGFKAKELVIKSENELTVIMIEDAAALDEVVVVGYGSVKKSDLTGSVVSLKSETLVERPVPSIDQAIQGRVAGVIARTNSAAPGGGMNIVIRGTGSLNSNTSPLYVLNGVPVDNVDNIPAEDVESIEILKDASATAIYGSRGANGVVLVTTKKGKIGKTSISYSNRFTYERVSNDLNIMNGSDFAQFYTQWELAQGADPANLFYNGSSAAQPLPENAGNTDWFDIITRSGLQKNHNLSVSGGSENNTYSVSLNYLDHEGVILGGDYERLSIALNNTYKVSSWLDMGFNLSISSDEENSSGDNVSLEGAGFSAINPAIKMLPTLSVFDENGDYQENILPGSQNRENPLAAAREFLNEQSELQAVGKLYLDFKLFEGFNFRTSLGTNILDRKIIRYNPSNTITGGLVGGFAENLTLRQTYYINEYLATYKKTIKKHDFNFLAGFSHEGQTNEGFSNSGTGFFTDAFENNNIEAANNIDADSFKNKFQLASFIGRINYNYDNRFLFTFTGRYDGSSRFAAKNQFAFFPAAAGAWKISEESFFPEDALVSFLKLRVSYGEAGNSNIGNYNSLATFNLANYTLGSAIVPGVGINRLQNDNFGWETLLSTNVGFDIGLLDNRINITADAYIKTTEDLIANASLIETSGLSSADINVGELENKGIELGVNARIITGENFNWAASANIALNSNEITKFNGDLANDWRIGEAVGATRGVDIDGIIRTQAELDDYFLAGAQLGDYRQVDQNGDGLLNGDDQVITFDPTPDFTYGFSHDFSYKNLSLSLAFYGSQGGQINNNTKAGFLNTNIVRSNLSNELLNNVWTPENPNAEFPALSSNITSGIPTIEDGSFLRLQNILLAYNFPEIKGFEGMNLSIYGSAQNVATWTRYSGLNPDANSTSGGGPGNIGVDRASFPLPESYTLGLKVGF